MEGDDIPSTFLFIFLAIIQVYIMIGLGVIVLIRKMFIPKVIKATSELLLNFFLPVYASLELARMATWDNVEVMWIMIITVFLSIILGFLLGQLTHWFFKFDERYRRSYPIIMSLPALGTLPLVMSRALCLPGGMLEGDPRCETIIGFMIMNFLVFQIILMGGGFILMPSDASLANTLMEKMSYIWHIIIPKVFDKDYSVYYIFNKFMIDDKTAKEKFGIFNKKYKLEVIYKENLIYKFIENKEIELDFVPEMNPLPFKEHSPSDKIIIIEEAKISKLEEAPEKNENIVTEKGLLNEVKLEFSNNDKSNNHAEHAHQEDDEHVQFGKELNFILADYAGEEEPKAEPVKVLSDEDVMNISLQKQKSIMIFENHIELYYQKLFGFVEKHLNEKKRDEYEQYKLHLFESVYALPPKFPAVKYLELTRDNIPLIEEEWKKFERKVKETQPEFVLKTKEIIISPTLIISKLHSPPILGCFLGLLIGMSGMRDILFSSNHYISNLVDGIQIVSKSNVPFQYILVGISFFSLAGGQYLDIPLTTRYVGWSIVIRFLLLPAVGLLYVFLWKNYYGGIVAGSKVFRICLFIPFALPSVGSIVVVVNIIKFFAEETGIILLGQNATDLVTLTVLYLIYYVTVG